MITLPGHRISLRLVAEHAGVSRMTVSLALRDDPSISAATRGRIKQLAERLGYIPDPDIAQLMDRIRERSRRAEHLKTLAFLTAHESRTGWRNDAASLMHFEGAEQQARAGGFKLDHFWLREPGMNGRRLARVLQTRDIEGVLIATVPGTEAAFDGFNWDGFSAVTLGSSLRFPVLHRACHHHFQSVCLLLQQLGILGYRRIGFAICEQSDERVRCLWHAGYLIAHHLRAGNEAIPPLIMHTRSKEEFSRWLRRHRPEAIVTTGGRVGSWLEEMDIPVPDEVGLASLDVRPNTVDTTGIDQNSRQLGATAIDLLLSLVRRHERGIPSVTRITMIEGTFVPGRTVRLLDAALPVACLR